MTYNEFKQKLEKLVIGYAMECESELNVNVIVKIDEKYAISENSDFVAHSKKYEARTTTEIG